MDLSDLEFTLAPSKWFLPTTLLTQYYKKENKQKLEMPHYYSEEMAPKDSLC